MNRLLAGAMAGALLIGAGAVVMVGDDFEDTWDGTIDPGKPATGEPEPQPLPYERELADKHVVTKGGKAVRVVGVRHKVTVPVDDDGNPTGPPEHANPSDTALGRTAEAVASPHMECNLIFAARDPEDLGLSGLVELGDVPGPEKVYAWLGRGQACLDAADLDGYLASSVHEMLSLQLKYQKVLLQQETDCDDGEGGTVRCWRPITNAGVNGDAEVRPIHHWAGRDGDLDHHRAIRGKAIGRYKPEDFQAKKVIK